jgi:hypothetical protein
VELGFVDRTLSGLRVSLTSTPGRSFASFADGAQRDLTGEFFRLDDADARAALKRLGADGIRPTMVVDPEVKLAPQGWLTREVHANVRSYGDLPLKSHTKAVVRDHNEAWMTTGAFSRPANDEGPRWDFVIRFRGDGARALEHLTRATFSRDPHLMHAAANEASRFGIVVNDPVAGVRTLTETVYDMVRRARERLVISTKIYDDPTFNKLVKQARKRGVDVRFTDLRAKGFHGNAVIADNAAYVGTAHISKRSLAGTTRRKAREIGIVTTDTRVVDSLLKSFDRHKLLVYRRRDFLTSADLVNRIDAYYQARERLGPRPSAEALAKVAALHADKQLAAAEWDKHTAVVQAKRAADGLRFSS